MFICRSWSKCPYCDFNSHVLDDESKINTYTKLIIKDIENEAKKFKQSKLKTIFIGGGTPNFLIQLASQKYLIQLIPILILRAIVRLQWKLIQAR